MSSSIKLLVGLTGNIACGKSTVVKTFEKHGIPNVDADIVARQVVVPGSLGYESIVSAFGSEILSGQVIDRAKLGSIVFSDKEKLETLNTIMAPLITAESEKQLAKLQETHPIVIYNAALICEMGNSKKYQPLIVVHCPLPTQLERLMSRNSLTRAEAMSRIEVQMTAAEKIKLADFAIDTSGAVEYSIKQTEDIIQKLQQM